MKKMKLQILFGVVLLGNAALMQGMTRSTRVFSQLKPGVKFRNDGHAMYSTSASPQQMSEIEAEEQPEEEGLEERLQKKLKELEDKLQGNVNSLKERRLHKERMKMQGQDPKDYVHSYDNSIFRVDELTIEQFKALDEDAQKEYIERLLDEEKNLPWLWEGVLDETGPEKREVARELKQLVPSNQQQKREIIRYYSENKKLAQEEQEKIEKEEQEKIEKEEQEKTEDGLWKRIKSLFSSGSKEE